MRLDARVNVKNFPFVVWHAELCQNIAKRTVWVDDQTHEYGIWPSDLVISLLSEPVTVLAKKIVIDVEQRFVIINPLEDGIVDAVQAEATKKIAELLA